MCKFEERGLGPQAKADSSLRSPSLRMTATSKCHPERSEGSAFLRSARRSQLLAQRGTRLAFFGALLFAMLVAGGLTAQEITGSIRGTVFDQSGAGVPSAEVKAVQVETGLERVTLSDRQGSYVLPLLSIGHYVLEVRARGFQS